MFNLPFRVKPLLDTVLYVEFHLVSTSYRISLSDKLRKRQTLLLVAIVIPINPGAKIAKFCKCRLRIKRHSAR